MRYASLARSMRGVFSADISRLTQTCDVLLQSCDALLQSCDALFYGEKTGFLAICASQPSVLKQKSTSQVAGCTSQVAKSTSQLGRSTSQVHLVYTVELSHLTVQGRTF